MLSLNQLSIIYIEEDITILDSLKKSFRSLFKEFYALHDGIEALKIYKEKEQNNQKTHIIISGIHISGINGLDLLKEIRVYDKTLPFILTTKSDDEDYLLRAIKLNATGYLIKPFKIEELITKIRQTANKRYQKELLLTQKNQLEKYLHAVDKVAIISKIDIKGIITFANDIFCDISKYTKKELYGKPHNIVRHPDMPSETFKNLWSTIKQGRVWQGKIKNRTKHDEAYFVNTTILPLFDDYNNIIEYMSIRFLTTNEELDKREFKKRILNNIQNSKKVNLKNSHRIKSL